MKRFESAILPCIEYAQDEGLDLVAFLFIDFAHQWAVSAKALEVLC